MSAEPLSSPASGAFRCSSRWLRSSRKTVLPIPCCPDACSSSVSPPVSAWKKQSLFSGCRLWWLFRELPRQRSGSPETTLSLHLTLFLSLSLTLSLSLSLRHNVQPVCHNVQFRCHKLLPVPEPVPAAWHLPVSAVLFACVPQKHFLNPSPHLPPEDSRPFPTSVPAGAHASETPAYP